MSSISENKKNTIQIHTRNTRSIFGFHTENRAPFLATGTDCFDLVVQNAIDNFATTNNYVVSPFVFIFECLDLIFGEIFGVFPSGRVPKNCPIIPTFGKIFLLDKRPTRPIWVKF